MMNGNRVLDMKRIIESTGLVLISLLTSLTSHAGTLEFFEASVGPGIPRSISAPANSVSLDIDYDATSAEGGGLYGFSETSIVTTGDVVIDAASFTCEAFVCLSFPSPFTGGTRIWMTAADDINGEFSGNLQLLTISVTGTKGYVAILGGEYIDATGASMDLGTVQNITTTVVAEVPEPGLATSLALGYLGLVLMRRFRD